MTAAAPPPSAGGSAPPVLLFDGVCVMCNGAVRFLIARDPGGRLRFAPLQGETAAALRTRHPGVPELSSAVFVEDLGGAERIHLESAAVFAAFRALAGPWRWFGRLAFLPRALTDAVYRLVMRNRYRLFGRYDACRVPSPEERARFLP